MKSVVELAVSGLQSAESSVSSNADPAKVGVWVQAETRILSISIYILDIQIIFKIKSL